MSNLTSAQLYLNYAAASDVDPYINANLTSFIGGVKILSNVLTLSNAGLYTGGVYVSATHTGSNWSAIAKFKSPSDLQGVILVNPTTGDGYMLRGNGNLRIHTLTAWGFDSGNPLTFGSTTLADGDDYELNFNGSQLRILKNDSLLETYTPSGGELTAIASMMVGWWYNRDNVGAGGASALGFNYLDVSGPTINLTPADIRVTEPRTIRVTAPTTAMTTGNTTVKVNNSGNDPITPSAVTNVSGLTYDVVFTVPDVYEGLAYSATGYPIIVTTTDGSVTSSNVDFLPVTGNGYAVLTDVSDTDITASPALEVDDQIEWTNAAVITIDAEGKVTSTEESATFQFRVWDHNDSTWGDWAEVVFGEGGEKRNSTMRVLHVSGAMLSRR